MFQQYKFLSLFLPVLAFGQGSVNVNVLELYGEVPAPPKTVHEAYSRAECTVNGDMYLCDTKNYYKKIDDKVAALGKQFEKAGVYLTQPTVNAMASVDPKEMQKKMATMTQAEQIAFAMEMNKKMGLGPKALAPEPEAVQEAMTEYQRINALNAAEMQDVMAILKKKNRIIEERNRKSKEIDVWAAAEQAKLPYIGDSEAGKYKDVKAIYAIEVRAMDKHITAENEYLAALQKQWHELLTGQKERYGKLQQKLAAIRYGEDAKNVETKRNLLGAQQLMMGPVDELLTLSKNGTDEAVNWWTQKLTLQQRSPL